MELLTINETAARLAIGRTKLWELATRDPDFPKPVSVTGRRKAFVKSEIDGWIAARIAERDGEAA
ncbi:helix-turn-helix transcriptional regulator [Oceaniradius stylonematis]|uniref:helix-turn-helix transcriptional regulator n=1 Tax=Oceaniradius stylonematis TaxID=2184161 RepID=UPI003C7A5628